MRRGEHCIKKFRCGMYWTLLPAPVAQLDRASAFEAECRLFESDRAYQDLVFIASTESIPSIVAGTSAPQSLPSAGDLDARTASMVPTPEVVEALEKWAT
jgi:hypothetical protein